MFKPTIEEASYMQFCEKCDKDVISLDGHCINDDSHMTYSLTKKERKEAQVIFKNRHRDRDYETGRLEIELKKKTNRVSI